MIEPLPKNDVRQELLRAEDPFQSLRDTGRARYPDEENWHYHRRMGYRLWHAGTYLWVVFFRSNDPSVPNSAKRVQFLTADPGVMVVLHGDGRTEIVDANDVYATEEEARKGEHRP